MFPLTVRQKECVRDRLFLVIHLLYHAFDLPLLTEHHVIQVFDSLTELPCLLFQLLRSVIMNYSVITSVYHFNGMEHVKCHFCFGICTSLLQLHLFCMSPPLSVDAVHIPAVYSEDGPFPTKNTYYYSILAQRIWHITSTVNTIDIKIMLHALLHALFWVLPVPYSPAGAPPHWSSGPFQQSWPLQS